MILHIPLKDMVNFHFYINSHKIILNRILYSKNNKKYD